MNNDDITFNFEKIEETKNGTVYKISVKIPATGWIDDVCLNIRHHDLIDKIPLEFKKHEGDYTYFETTHYFDTKAIYRYYLTYTSNRIEKSFPCNPKEENLKKISSNFNVPDWAKGKVIYHIFVDRFNCSKPKEEIKERKVHRDIFEDPVIGPDETGKWNNDYFGGDLQGIIEKLDYIKSLGVSIIYLSPIVESQSNHRYDTANYLHIDPYVGCEEDLRELCEKAHQKGMRIILDAVFNHTGNDSKYFNEFNHYNSIGAYQSTNSPYYDFYRKDNSGNFEYWWGMKNLPVCDGNNKKWQDYITGENGVIDRWFSTGIDGLRLDVADELTDEYIEKIREAVHRNKKDGFIIGEVWKNPMHMGRGYISSGKGMDSVMNYYLMDALIRYYKFADIDKLKRVLEEIIKEYPTDTIYSLMNSTSTHDISRAIDIFSSDKFTPYNEWAWDIDNGNYELIKNHQLTDEEYAKGKEIFKSYLFALTFLPGNLSIFYGDEVGLEGIGNLLNRRNYPWGKEDYDLLAYFRFLGQIREKEPFLEQADLKVRDINPNYFIFERIAQDNKALVAVNRTPNKGRILIPPEYEQPKREYAYQKCIAKIL